jgi:hypothetical protein
MASFLIDGRVCELSLVSLAAFVRAGSAETRGRKLVCRVVLLRAHRSVADITSCHETVEQNTVEQKKPHETV